ncbi:hypothetical protein F8M41_011093 [Gigaspora margarita]|uniref:Uncharacterized protein n=1 Tax=Gigaspora margarita TaxID=4874 RepID=A0A8H4AU18_GIGMA|nr:hypothetical protein F8M41_011093 [Gigaspora margarita]
MPFNFTKPKLRESGKTSLKEGKKWVLIFRVYNDVEFEVAKSHEQTKLLMDSYKLEKVLKDIYIQLCKEIKMKLKIKADTGGGYDPHGNPNEYISIINKGEQLFEAPSNVKKLQDLMKVLANIWVVKEMIRECIKIVNLRDERNDVLNELVNMGNHTESSSRKIVLSWTYY